MTRGTPPLTHYASRLTIDYIVHQTAGALPFFRHRINLYKNQTPIDDADAAATATSVAFALAQSSGTNVSFQEYHVTPFGGVLAPGVGFAGGDILGDVDPAAAGRKIALSAQMTLSGLGTPVNAGEAPGKWEATWYTGHDFAITAAIYRFATNIGTGFSQAFTLFNDPAADFTNIYGQSTQMYPTGTFQFNSFIERKYGH